MAHANAIFLSLLSGAALVLALAPGCSNSTAQPAVAVVWTVSQGPNGAGTCGAVYDTFSIGSFSGNPLVTASNGSTYAVSDGGAAPPVTVQCTVAQNANGYSVQAFVQYGDLGNLTISGEIAVSGNAKPGTQTNISGEFSDGIGLAGASMSDSNCTITFTQNGNMGVAPTRIWGVIDCPNETQAGNSAAQNCDGNAQFLFENCGQ
jgi:hypothetical protein